MQTLREIRTAMSQAGIRANRRLGQNFLIDGNLMLKLLELAEVSRDETVLEVGAGTGSLTEELLKRARRVVAVEIDPGLCGLLRRRLAGANGLTIVCGDVLAGKSQISPAVLNALVPAATLVSNLPYGVATPLISQLVLDTWRLAAGGDKACCVEKLAFTVQKEVADRLTAGTGQKSYGRTSVLVGLTCRVTKGPVVPASAFWPRPEVDGRLLRLDFDRAAAAALPKPQIVMAVTALAFSQRRKRIGAMARRKDGPFSREALSEALRAAGTDSSLRPEQLPPQKFADLARHLPTVGERNPTGE